MRIKIDKFTLELDEEEIATIYHALDAATELHGPDSDYRTLLDELDHIIPQLGICL